MNKHLVIIGFGNQAKSWALNLRDSGWRIDIALRKISTKHEIVQKLGFNIIDIDDPMTSDTVGILTPDDTHLEILQRIKLKKNSKLIYAHGFSLLYSPIPKQFPEHQHILLAPKAIASELRFQYELQGKLGGVYSLEHAPEIMTDYVYDLAADLGLNALYKASVEAETKADLFSEQSLLCSILPYSALYSFNKLREKGISKEVAYFECWYEVKLIVDTMIKIGPSKFFELISPNALIGSEIGREIFFNKDYQDKLSQIYENIESKNFIDQITLSDLKGLKAKVLKFWEEQELQHLHDEMGSKLF